MPNVFTIGTAFLQYDVLMGGIMAIFLDFYWPKLILLTDKLIMVFSFVFFGEAKCFESICDRLYKQRFFFDGDQHSKLEYCRRQSLLDYNHMPQKLLARAAFLGTPAMGLMKLILFLKTDVRSCLYFMG